MIPHINVLIATPGYALLGGYVKSLLETFRVFSENNISFAYLNDYSSHVADAREVTLSGTRSNNLQESRPLSGQVTYDTILWIDSDISWTPEDALKLINSDKDITTGVYLLSNGDSIIHPISLGRPYKYEDILEKTELEKIDGCGFGFIAIKQGVFEKLPRPWFQSASVSHEIEGGTYDFNVIGEDLSFCLNAKKLGFDIWFDPTVRVNHHKSVVLTWKGIQPC